MNHRLRTRMVFVEDDGDRFLVLRRRPTRPPTPAQNMARNGEFGENEARLLEAAEWFEQQALLAGLSRRRTWSAQPAQPRPTREAQYAIARLAKLEEQLGAAAYTALLEGCLWHQVIPKARRALFCQALLVVARRRKSKNPPRREPEGVESRMGV